MSVLSKSFLGAIIIVTPLLSAATDVVAADIEMSGSISTDAKFFPQKAIHAGQEGQMFSPSLAIQAEVNSYWNNDDDSLTFVPYLRLDGYDQERTHGDIRELYYQHIDDGWDVKVGLDKVYWGVIESQHLVDIINQTDSVDSSDGESKLGQPMINVGIQPEWGDVNLLLMPYFRERTFPGSDGRLRSSLVVDTDQTTYQSASEELHPDVALRYSTVLDDIDLGLGYFYGTSREPGFSEGTNSSGDSVFIPNYEIIGQASIDAQMTIEEWLWKVEGIRRTGHGNAFYATSVGLEYTYFSIIDEYGDLGLIAEYHYDGRDGNAPSTLYNNDIFLGARVALNDPNDTSFLAGVIIDRYSQEQLYSVEASTRLSDQWTMDVEASLNNNLVSSSPLYGARRDDYMQVSFTHYF